MLLVRRSSCWYDDRVFGSSFIFTSAQTLKHEKIRGLLRSPLNTTTFNIANLTFIYCPSSLQRPKLVLNPLATCQKRLGNHDRFLSQSISSDFVLSARWMKVRSGLHYRSISPGILSSRYFSTHGNHTLPQSGVSRVAITWFTTHIVRVAASRSHRVASVGQQLSGLSSSEVRRGDNARPIEQHLAWQSEILKCMNRCAPKRKSFFFLHNWGWAAISQRVIPLRVCQEESSTKLSSNSKNVLSSSCT